VKTRALARSVVALFLGALIAASSAVAGSGGSAYSLLGLGDIRYVPGARAAGMGYTGIGLAAPQYINGMSPASWFKIDRTRLEGSALYEGFGSTDGVTSRYLARLDFHGALLAIPISPAEGIVFVGGFVPYSNVSYDTYTSGSYLRTGVDTVNLPYRLHHVGVGGITRGVVGLSWLPAPSVALGASFNYMFGTLTSSIQQIPTQAGIGGGTIDNNEATSGTSVTVGALITGFGGVSESLAPLSLGVIVTTRANLHTEDDITYTYTLERDTAGQRLGRVAIPFSYGIGLGYQASDRWTLAADYFAQPWSRGDFEGVTPAGIRDSYRVGIGAERSGSKELNAGWLDRIAYRFGFMYHQTYYILNNTPINEWGVTAGMAFPLSGDSRLNVAGEYGSRGSTGNGLIEDKIWRITISLNISDLWFVRNPEE
jgi:hypothetical protein